MQTPLGLCALFHVLACRNQTPHGQIPCESFACLLHFAHRVGLIAHSWLAAVWVGASVEPGAGGETVEPQVQT